MIQTPSASRLFLFVIAALTLLLSISSLAAQDAPPTADDVAAEVGGDDPSNSADVSVADQVEVEPLNSDEKIQQRLQEILEATGWFTSPQVRVDRGVVFLSGVSDTKKHQAWAESTAIKTKDVVAVVNRIKVSDPPFWNFAPALESLKQLGRDTASVLPLIAIALVVMAVFYILARLSAVFTRWLTRNRLDSKLLRQVAGNVVGVLIFVVGAYVALRVSGLTRLAVTILGGTGLVGLALGFAFRDIAENYLASILISLNHPFRVGDLIEVEGAKGFVRKVTTRGTVLNTLEGNQIQMPNSTVYKGKIINFTATPLTRIDFAVGIGFDDSTVDAQQIIMSVLEEHSAVVADPAPIVIVEALGAATVNLRVYLWFDQTKHSPLKVSSSVIRLVKQKLTEAEISMPDEAREIVFPYGVPVQLLDAKSGESQQLPTLKKPASAPAEPTASIGEGNLASEQAEVMRATDDDETIEGDANLID